MKKNLFSIKKPKWGLIALFMTFCCLFGNTAFGQAVIPSSNPNNDIIVWTGAVSSNWNDVDNWYVQSRAVAGVAGTSEYPGQVDQDDWAVIPSNGTNPPIITNGQTIQIARLSITNQFNVAGGTLTINTGGTLNLVNTLTGSVALNGGSIVNNGALNINTSGVGFASGGNFPTIGINCGTPNILPTLATEYGYSGSGTLNINLSAANFAGAAAIAVNGINSTNITYRMVLNNPTITLNQASVATISAIRANGGTSANKLILAGSGLTLGTVGTPVKGSLLNVGNQANVVVESGTTLTLHSAATNTNAAITGGNSSNNIPTEIVNKGTINVLGSSSRSGLQFSTFGGSQGPPSVQSTTPQIVNFTNEGTINIDLDIIAIGGSSFNIGNGGGGTAFSGSICSLINTSTGTITLKNRSAIVGTGFAITATVDGQAPRGAFVNAGTLNLESSVYHYGAKMSITNTGIINTNNELRGFSSVNNNAGGSINFARNAATATNKFVTFNGLPTGNAANTGDVYTDGTNNYTVVLNKYAATSIITNVATSANTASISTTSGTLTKLTGAGTATQTYTATAAVVGPPAVAASPSFSASSAKGALTSGTSGGGTINTDTGSDYLNSLSGLSGVAATGTVSPGGASGKGIAEINRYEWFGIYGTAKIQVSGNTTAGVDYDQLNNALGGIDISTGTLDVTGIYTPSGTLASPIDIISAGSTQPLVGSFATVTGLAPGWSVNYTGTESIDPGTSLPYVPTRREGGKVQLSYVQTPYITQLSSNGTDTITQGCEGTTLVILGSKFTGATAVTVNGVALTGVTVVSDTRIDAVLPMGATSGLVAVTGSEATGSSAGNFSVVAYSSNTTTVSSFLTYTWGNNGQTYTTSGTKTGTTSANCVTELLDLTIETTQIPDTFPAFCKGANIATATGTTTMKFYSALTGGVALASTTALANAKTLFVTEVINSVEVSPRLARLITVNPLPATPSLLVSNPLTESKNICKYIGTSTPMTFDVTASGAVSYLWTAPGTAQVVSGATSSSAGISFQDANTVAGPIGSVIVRSVDANGCISLPKSLALTTKAPTAPTALVMTSADATPLFNGIITPANPLALPPTPAVMGLVGLNTLTAITKVGPYMGTNTVFTLTAPVAVTAASYRWTLPTGVNPIGSATVTNVGSGIATSTTPVITVNFAGVPAGIGTLPLTVQSVGGCGNSSNRTLTLARVVPTAPKALTLTCTNTTPRFSYKDPLTGITSLDGLDVLSKINKVGPYQKTTIGFTLTSTPIVVQGGTATSYAWVLPTDVTCTDCTATNVTQRVETGLTPEGAKIFSNVTFPAWKTNSTVTPNALSILFNTAGIGNLDLLAFAINGAGNSVARKLVVTRSLPTAPTKLVLTDNAISPTAAVTKVGPYVGKTTVLTLTGTPFTTQGAEGRKFYWTLPAGVRVLSGVIAAELTTPPATDISGNKTWTSAFTSNANPTPSSVGMLLTVNLADIAPGVTSIPLSVKSQNEAGTSATARTLTLTAVLPTAPTALVLKDGSTVVTTAGAYTSKTTPLTLTATPTLNQGDTTFSWVLPAGVNVTGGATNVTTPVTDVSGNRTWTSTGTELTIDLNGIGVGVLSIPMNVYAVNGVGTSTKPRLLTVKAAAPATPGSITTPSLAVPKFNPACPINTTITVQVPAVAGATYAWTVAGGIDRIVSGNGTNSIVINIAGVTTTTLSVSVVASNGTGSSSPKTLSIGKTTVCSAKIAPETANTSFDVKAYPNPSSSEFTIETSAKGTINAKVYDMQGRLVEKANTNKVGSRLAAGTYNVIVNQGANTKSVRVIKK